MHRLQRRLITLIGDDLVLLEELIGLAEASNQQPADPWVCETCGSDDLIIEVPTQLNELPVTDHHFQRPDRAWGWWCPCCEDDEPGIVRASGRPS